MKCTLRTKLGAVRECNERAGELGKFSLKVGFLENKLHSQVDSLRTVGLRLLESRRETFRGGDIVLEGAEVGTILTNSESRRKAKVFAVLQFQGIGV